MAVPGLVMEQIDYLGDWILASSRPQSIHESSSPFGGVVLSLGIRRELMEDE